MRRDIFFGFRWCESAPRKGIKKARDAITFRTEGIRKPRLRNAPRPCKSRPYGRNKTRAGNIYTLTFEKFLIFLLRYKELLLFIMSVGYAEL